MSSGRRTPTQSLLISLAGPAVTFGIALICLPIGAQGVVTASSEGAFRQYFIIHELGRLELLLGFLNLIPSLPFDGGQAVAAIVSHRVGEYKAWRHVAHFGLILSPILVLWGFISDRDYLTMFGLIGTVSSLIHLLSTGGIRFGEAAADRKHAKEMEAVRRREAARQDAYLDEVAARLKEREEQERLKKLFGE